MKEITARTLAVGLVLGMTGCATQQELAKNQTAAQEWLQKQNAGARIQVSGTWYSADWGRATFRQSGREISGTLDTYEVRGVASGSKAYLTTWDSGKCYYAIILSQSGKNVLTGTYTDGPAFLDDPKEQRAIELRRSY